MGVRTRHQRSASAFGLGQAGDGAGVPAERQSANSSSSDQLSDPASASTVSSLPSSYLPVTPLPKRLLPKLAPHTEPARKQCRIADETGDAYDASPIKAAPVPFLSGPAPISMPRRSPRRLGRAGTGYRESTMLTDLPADRPDESAAAVQGPATVPIMVPVSAPAPIADPGAVAIPDPDCGPSGHAILGPIATSTQETPSTTSTLPPLSVSRSRRRTGPPAPSLPPVMESPPARSTRTAGPRAATSRSARRPRASALPGSAGQSTPTTAALAVLQDAGKPREERDLRDFHPNLDIDQPVRLFSTADLHSALAEENAKKSEGRKVSKRTARPILRIPAAIPIHKTRNRLKLHRPLFRSLDVFSKFSQAEPEHRDDAGAAAGRSQLDGFQAPGRFDRPTGSYIRQPGLVPAGLLDSGSAGAERTWTVEYDMDVQDVHWLNQTNASRKAIGAGPVSSEVFELVITVVDREWTEFEKKLPKPTTVHSHPARARSSSATAVKGDLLAMGDDADSRCAICDDGDCENSNAIVFCDGCDLAVHQECYGVPFIPEGQWLCRRCQLVGPDPSAWPNCVFCPNTDGAMKQTDDFLWVHVMCALWIPEVTVGNTAFMEPILAVDRVPVSRWRLNCYICSQRMGACVQCSHRNCFAAFHITCARRAGLFLRLKPPSGAPAGAGLAVFCDKHTPDDWSANNDVKGTMVAAQKHYSETMKNRVWNDGRRAPPSRNSARSGLTSSCSSTGPATATNGTGSSLSSLPVTAEEMAEMRKRVWRLPSGAPIIPAAILVRVAAALAGLVDDPVGSFAADVCKYWTLKRESRRGALLLRPQQAGHIDAASTELVNRDFAEMGVSGREVLRARVDFARRLERELGMIGQICELVSRAETGRARRAILAAEILDQTYFPVIPLLRPIIAIALDLDPDQLFDPGFVEIEGRVENRQYASVYTFARDMWRVLCMRTGNRSLADMLSQTRIRLSTNRNSALNIQRQRCVLARQIYHAVFPPMMAALAQERDLLVRPAEPANDGDDGDDDDVGDVGGGGQADNEESDVLLRTVYRDDGHGLMTIDLGLDEVNSAAKPLNTGTFAHPGTPQLRPIPGLGEFQVEPVPTSERQGAGGMTGQQPFGTPDLTRVDTREARQMATSTTTPTNPDSRMLVDDAGSAHKDGHVGVSNVGPTNGESGVFVVHVGGVKKTILRLKGRPTPTTTPTTTTTANFPTIPIPMSGLTLTPGLENAGLGPGLEDEPHVGIGPISRGGRGWWVDGL